ncbi:MAG TPA: ABC transporter ATP-binding protein [Mycobacteriales bacterium]|jgi:branched-chain amino acid transport system ATP-binding protein
MTALLDVRGLDVSYGAVTALRDVDLTVGAGEVVAVVGANGAGKSTLLKTVSGLLSPVRGEIVFDGEDIAGKPAFDVVKRGLTLLPEGRELFRDLSVLDNLHLGFWPTRKPTSLRDERVERAFDIFPRLKERAHQRASTLSGGEAQMLGVARALMCSPKLLVVDELSLGLAPKVVSQLFDVLGEVNAAGTSLLLVEQFVHLALEHSHRAYVLAKGSVALSGPSSELLADPAVVASYLGGSAPVPAAT